MSFVLVLHLQAALPLFSQRSRNTKDDLPIATMSQTSTIVHSIDSSKSVASPGAKTKNLAVPLAVLLSLEEAHGRADGAVIGSTRRRVARLSRLAKNPTPSAWTEFPATYDASRV